MALQLHESLIALARELAKGQPDVPEGPARLHRATSTAYYALFHAMCADAADMLAGRDSPEWLRVYRGLEHPLCKTACEEIGRNLEFSSGIKNCANHFISLQKARHSADYDPSWRISGVNAKAHIAAAREAINELFEAPLRERQTFALRRLIRRPRN